MHRHSEGSCAVVMPCDSVSKAAHTCDVGEDIRKCGYESENVDVKLERYDGENESDSEFEIEHDSNRSSHLSSGKSLTVRKFNSDIPISETFIERSNSPPLRREDTILTDRLHVDTGSFRRCSSTDQLGVSKMRDWLRAHGIDPDLEHHVLSDAYIQDSMEAFKDGR